MPGTPRSSPRPARSSSSASRPATLSLIALHSAHWSTPFVEAMQERARLDADRELRDRSPTRSRSSSSSPPPLRRAQGRRPAHAGDQPLRKFPDGRISATVHLPNCCFPPTGRWQAELPARPEAGPPHRRGTARRVRTRPDRNVLRALPRPRTDEVIFEEPGPPAIGSGAGWSGSSAKAASSTSGPVTRPSPSTRTPTPEVLANAVAWLGSQS